MPDLVGVILVGPNSPESNPWRPRHGRWICEILAFAERNSVGPVSRDVLLDDADFADADLSLAEFIDVAAPQSVYREANLVGTLYRETLLTGGSL